MEEARRDRIGLSVGELAAGMRAGFGGVDTRLCKIEVRLGKMEVRLDQTATKVDLNELRTEMYKANAEMKTWLLATMITIIGLFLVALFGLHHWNG